MKIILALVLFAVQGIAAAQDVGGLWSTHVEYDGRKVLYEVHLHQADQRVIGRWSVDGIRSASGCLVGDSKRNVVRFRTCTTDGSAGARARQAVCPRYHPDQNRLVARGPDLAWEVWDAQRHAWRPLVLLARKQAAQPLSWNEEECGRS